MVFHLYRVSFYGFFYNYDWPILSGLNPCNIIILTARLLFVLKATMLKETVDVSHLSIGGVVSVASG